MQATTPYPAGTFITATEIGVTGVTKSVGDYSYEEEHNELCYITRDGVETEELAWFAVIQGGDYIELLDAQEASFAGLIDKIYTEAEYQEVIQELPFNEKVRDIIDDLCRDNSGDEHENATWGAAISCAKMIADDPAGYDLGLEN